MSHFFFAVWLTKSVILALIALIVAGAGAITLNEKMPFADTLYFAFVTGLMVAVLVYAVRESMTESQKRG